MNNKPFSQTDFGLKNWGWYGIGILLITVCGVALYSGVLFSKTGVPWGSDTFGHIYRFEFLRQSLEEGILSPDFFPDWYLGIQLFRYYPPILYYGLAWFSSIIGNPIQTAFWGLFLIGWLGSLSWLLLHRWLGWIPTILGGILYYLLPDLIRVGFAEGNLLRHLANALLPLLFFFVLNLLEEGRRRNWMQVGLGLVLAVMVLSHPMMTAISGVVVALLLIGAFLVKKITFQQLLSALISAVLGILISSWWLLPSMSGGITELNSDAMINTLRVVSILTLFNPLTRMHNIEELYVSGALIVGNLGLLFFQKVRQQKEFLLFLLVGLLTCLLATPLLKTLYFSIPFSSLMWPSRYLTFGSFLLLFSAMLGLSKLTQKQILPAFILLGAIVFDFGGSTRLMYADPQDRGLIEGGAYLSMIDGWREATVDYSRIGSVPSYYFSEFGEREQLFGWGFQGAKTAPLVSSINESLQKGLIPYALDRFNLLGGDDVLIAEGMFQPYGLQEALVSQGYKIEPIGDNYKLYHRVGAPRAVEANWPAIGIGSVAQNYAYLFPQIMVADSVFIDDYILDDLRTYDLVVLAGFSWHDKEAAEELVIALSQTGTMVVVDLTQTEENVFSQQSEFLEVWGERVILDQEAKIVSGADKNYTLTSMHNDGALWYTFTPQNLNHEELTTEFLGQRLVLTGYNKYDSGKVWFIGLNLAYHTVINEDTEALQLLADFFTIEQGQLTNYEEVQLNGYETTGSMIRFYYSLEEDTRLLLPFARFDGTEVSIDGKLQAVNSLSNLIIVEAPAGIHDVEITFSPTPIYFLGKVASLIAISLFGMVNLPGRSKKTDETKR